MPAKITIDYKKLFKDNTPNQKQGNTTVWIYAPEHRQEKAEEVYYL